MLRTLALDQRDAVLLFACTCSGPSSSRGQRQRRRLNTLPVSSEASAAHSLPCSLSIKAIKSMADEVNRWQTSWQTRASCSISCENKLPFPTASLSDSKTDPAFRALGSLLRHLCLAQRFGAPPSVSGYGGAAGAPGAAGQSRASQGAGGETHALFFASGGGPAHSFSSRDVLSNQDAGQVDSSLSVLIKQ